MSERKKLLFLAFSFPPLQAVSSVRAANVAKHLGMLGWDVAVVTPDPRLWQSPDDMEQADEEIRSWGVRTIHTGHRWRWLSSGHVKRSYRRGVRWFMEGVPRWISKKLHVDEMIGWYGEAERACAKLQPGDIDIILATGSPFGSFRVAQRLGRRLQCPFVLDYRDLWTDNPHVSRARRGHCRRIERQLLEECAAVSVVSPSMKQCLGEMSGLGGKIHVIPNGFDPADFENVKAAGFDHFAIVYAGQFLPPKRSARPLMQALRRLTELGPARPWRFHYYGTTESHVREAAAACGVEDHVVLHGKVPRRQCLAAIRGAGAATVVVSVFDSGDLADRGIVTGKIFEPIGLGTPTLVVAPPGSDVHEVVEATGNGAVFGGSQVDEIAAFFADLMRGMVPESRHPEIYSWPNLIQRFDQMLQQAM
ncbi:MAG: glycosyltransferase [Pirellulales bacterium]|nr:glycosyltransferase [Pirellulales bacterium]